MLRFLILGDIFGRNGRRLLKRFMPELKERYTPDVIIGNSENLTSGNGPSLRHILDMKGLGFDCLTGGNHIFAKLSDIREYLDSPDTIQIRPANYYAHPDYRVPGRGWMVIEKEGKRILVINIMSSVFIGGQLYNPFMRIREILEEVGSGYDAIIVDFHRETTAESYVMSEYLDGKVSFLFGTHTHVQTNDEHILKGGTGMITDIGMVGPIHSSIGQRFEDRMPQFLTGINIFNSKPEQDLGPGCVNGVYLEVEDMKCVKIEKIRLSES